MSIIYTKETKIFRQELWFMILFAILTVATIVLAIIAPESWFYFALTSVLLYAFLLVFYFRTKIIITENSLTYQTLFKSRSMNFSDVRRITTVAKIKDVSTTGFHATYNTTLFSDNDDLNIYIKTFSRKSLKEITGILMLKCINAEIDQKTQNMKDGKMPSALFD